MQAGRGQAARRQEEEKRRAEITTDYIRVKILFVLSVLHLHIILVIQKSCLYYIL